jgi:uncharacterized membrane protein
LIEQLLNLAWLSIAIFAFMVVLPSVPRRRSLAAVALAGTLVLLFPIISISDDLSADSVAQEVLAVLFAVAGLVVILIALMRLASISSPQQVLATIASSDPRSPPRV